MSLIPSFLSSLIKFSDKEPTCLFEVPVAITKKSAMSDFPFKSMETISKALLSSN